MPLQLRRGERRRAGGGAGGAARGGWPRGDEPGDDVKHAVDDRPEHAEHRSRCGDPLDGEHTALGLGGNPPGGGTAQHLDDRVLAGTELGRSTEHGPERVEVVADRDREPRHAPQAQLSAGTRATRDHHVLRLDRDGRRTRPRCSDGTCKVAQLGARHDESEPDALLRDVGLEGDLRGGR